MSRSELLRVIAKALALVALCSHVTLAAASEDSLAPFTPQRDLKGAWEFQPDPRLPNVLLLGDSISLGYTRAVRELLHGKANVFRAMRNRTQPDNCGDTRMSLPKIDGWLGDRHWDVIHFNWGLWDLCYRNPQSKTQGHRDKVTGTLAVSPEEYERNLEVLVQRLEKTGATLIWASTTVVPDGEAGRFVGDEVKYNRVAARVMQRHRVAVDDLHTLTRSFAGRHTVAPGDVHFTPDGYREIARQVAAEIGARLESAPAASPRP